MTPPGLGGNGKAEVMSGYEVAPRRSGGAIWFWLPIILILVLGAGFSAAVFVQHPSMSPVEALAAGFGGLAALIVGLFAAAVGVIIGVAGAALGLVAAGGAVAFTFFLLASPILAIVFFVLFMRQRRSGRAAMEPGAH